MHKKHHLILDNFISIFCIPIFCVYYQARKISLTSLRCLFRLISLLNNIMKKFITPSYKEFAGKKIDIAIKKDFFFYKCVKTMVWKGLEKTLITSIFFFCSNDVLNASFTWSLNPGIVW